MKKILFITLINVCVIQFVFSWDTTAAKLYPVTIGNIWSYNYKVFSGPGGCNNINSEINYLVTITRDTLMPNSKRYFVFESSHLGTFYRRIDSSSMNVYQYSTGTGNECVYDSLKGNVTGTNYNTCNTPYTITGSSNVTVFGALRYKRDSRPVPCPGCGRSLVAGIGYYEDYLCLTSGNRTALNGCIINGIQYGQIILGINQISSEIPGKFELSQNYPNPFNPVTKIKFAISGTSAAQTFLSVYDLLGREVSVLVNQQLQPGSYEADWPAKGGASSYPSGVYYYKLESGTFTETKKMVLIK